MDQAVPYKSGASHCVLIPSYNSGALLRKTLESVLKYKVPIFVVVDGSTDGSDFCLEELLHQNPQLRVLRLPHNQGKGAAVLMGMNQALKAGFTHGLVFDSDDQHASEDLPKILKLSNQHPEAMILASPIFGEDAPLARVLGRRLGNWWTNVETLWGGIGDSLFGLRVYPLAESIRALSETDRGRRFDFETQLAVRLYRQGVPPICIPSPVRYAKANKGGVSHFAYIRDNLLLLKTHASLVWETCSQLEKLWHLRSQNAPYRALSKMLANPPT